MKTPKCTPILSLALTGLLMGAPPVLASPLLDSDLASFTILGASSARHTPQITRQSSDSRSDSVKAIAAINASPGSAGLANPMTGSQQGVGSDVMQLAQALHLVALANHGPEAVARPSSVKELAADTGKTPRPTTRNNRDIERKYLCAMAQANVPVAAFDPNLCKDISTLSAFQAVVPTPETAANPSLGQTAPSTNHAKSDQATGGLTEELQRTLLLATLPADVGPNSDSAGGVSSGSPIQSSSPDMPTAFAIIPSALDIDELAATVPEPATLVLLALGLAGLGYNRKRAA